MAPAMYAADYYNTRGQHYYYPTNPVANIPSTCIPRRVPSTQVRHQISSPAVTRAAPVPCRKLVSETLRHVELKDEVSEPLQLTEKTLDKLMRLPESIQMSLLKLIEQQNRIQIMQLSGVGGNTSVNNSSEPVIPGARAQATPPKIPPFRKPADVSGLQNKQLTLEEIRQLNQANLALASNEHLKNKPLQRRGLEFSDEAAVLKTLVELNPAWRDHPEALMAAMKAKLGQQPLELRVAPEDDFSKQLVVDEGWKNVKQEVTHQLEIVDAEGGARVVPAVKVYDNPLIYVLPDLLSSEECDILLELTASHWAKGGGIARLPRHKNEFCDRLLKRVAAAWQCPEEEVEELHMISYPKGEQSQEHVDSVQRCSTMIVYLNDLPSSGQTDFIQLGFQIQPQKGTAAFWHNALQDENGKWTDKVDERTAHASLPCNEGTKLVLVAYRKNPFFLEF